MTCMKKGDDVGPCTCQRFCFLELLCRVIHDLVFSLPHNHYNPKQLSSLYKRQRSLTNSSRIQLPQLPTTHFPLLPLPLTKQKNLTLPPKIKMRTSHHAVPVTTRRTKPSLLSRLFAVRRTVPARSHGHGHTTTTTTTRRRHHRPAAVVPAHHKRRPSIGDKIAGALMRLKGSLTRRSGVKVGKTIPLPLFFVSGVANNALLIGCGN